MSEELKPCPCGAEVEFMSKPRVKSKPVFKIIHKDKISCDWLTYRWDGKNNLLNFWNNRPGEETVSIHAVRDFAAKKLDNITHDITRLVDSYIEELKKEKDNK